MSAASITSVEFHGDTLFAMEHEGEVLVALKPISDGLGLCWGSQYNRLLRDPILAEGVFKMKMPSPGGSQDTVCLRLSLLNGWLFGISENAIKDGRVRERVLGYKRECYDALHNHFYGRMGAARTDAFPPMGMGDARKEPIRVRRQLVSEARQSYGSHAARQLWAYLDLPIVPAMETPVAPEFAFTYTALRKEPAPGGAP